MSLANPRGERRDALARIASQENMEKAEKLLEAIRKGEFFQKWWDNTVNCVVVTFYYNMEKGTCCYNNDLNWGYEIGNLSIGLSKEVLSLAVFKANQAEVKAIEVPYKGGIMAYRFEVMVG